MNSSKKITGTLVNTSRRSFLVSTGALASTLVSAAPLTVLGGEVQNSASNWSAPRRCVFQQQSYFSFDGTGTPYDAPRTNTSTRDYVNSLSREEYLRRHWFI